MRITRTRTMILASLLAAAGLAAGPASAFDPEVIFGPHLESVPFEPWSPLRPAMAGPSRAESPLREMALFRFIDRLPFEPTSIGPEPRLPYDPEPVMGLVFVVQLD